jgi:hypothetical protein
MRPSPCAVASPEPDPFGLLLEQVERELDFFPRLHWSLREEIRQEIGLWLVRKRRVLDLQTSPRAFAAALVRQFLRPENLRRWAVEEMIEEVAARRHSSLRSESGADERLAAAEWLRALAPRDRRLAVRLLSGASWIEACDKENVPAGSRAFRRAGIKAALVGGHEG